MNEHIIQTLMEAVQQQETEMKELKSLVSQMGNLNGNAESLSADLKEVTALMKKVHADKQPLSQQITRLHHQLSQPVAHQHHHHVHKLIWIAAGLFLGLAITLVGWYNTGQQLSAFRSSDTKLRYLRLQHVEAVQKWVHVADSLHLAGPERLRDSVQMEEATRQWRRDLLEEAARKEADAEVLRRRAKE